MKRLIKNAQVVLENEVVSKDVLFDEEQILQIADTIELSAADAASTQMSDAAGLTLLPGLVDTHVHLRDPGYEAKETIATGTMAAAHGGFTTIFAMPNLNPYPSDVATMKAYLEKIDAQARVRVIPFATITQNEAGQKPVDYAALKELGIHWFSDDGVGVQKEEVMAACMEQARQAGVGFSCHTEDMNWRKPGASVHESPVFAQTDWIGIPSACESDQLLRDLKLAGRYGLPYHADHISAKSSVEALQAAKEAGVDCSAEVTAHHLLLEDVDVKGPNWKMNPPLRSHEDRMALIEGLENGVLDWIASDHAPHTKEEKQRPMAQAPFGIVGLETSFPLLYTEFVHRQKRWSLPQLVYWMSTAPARRFRLARTGEIKEGFRPDFVLADLRASDVVDPERFCSKGTNTPFAGWETACQIVETICSGKTVWKNTERKEG